MKIFVTGATGFVGSAVVRELLQAGHEVFGLVRSDGAAQSLLAAGAKAYRGELEDLDTVRNAAGDSDGVIHTGFNHDFSKFKENCELDRKVIETLGLALGTAGRPLVITSAIGVLPGGARVTEDTRPLSPSPNPRAASEEAARALIERGVRVSIVRLPPSVHGDGDQGFVPILIKIARDKKTSAFIGVDEAAHGACYHAVAEEGMAYREIAEVIGRRLNVPVVSKTPEEAAAHFTWFAHFAALNVVASSEQTQAKLGWRPNQPGLITDLDRPAYFAA
jgi:nucleoside-diphosphate-sugar epimerase